MVVNSKWFNGKTSLIFARFCTHFNHFKQKYFKDSTICYTFQDAQQKSTQQNSYSISHLLDTVTTQWLDNDGVATVVME